METLLQQRINELNKKHEALLKEIEDPQKLEYQMRWNGNKKYKSNPKEKYIKYLQKKLIQDIENATKEYNEVMGAEDFTTQEFIINIEWVRSKMWGFNPKVSTNYGFNESSISGCGYCKHSTATAKALNSFLPLLKLLWVAKEKKLNLENRDALGYGSGCGYFPKFEGGVGVSSHQDILKRLGVSMTNIISTKNADVWQIKKRFTAHDLDLSDLSFNQRTEFDKNKVQSFSATEFALIVRYLDNQEKDLKDLVSQENINLIRDIIEVKNK